MKSYPVTTRGSKIGFSLLFKPGAFQLTYSGGGPNIAAGFTRPVAEVIILAKITGYLAVKKRRSEPLFGRGD